MCLTTKVYLMTTVLAAALAVCGGAIVRGGGPQANAVRDKGPTDIATLLRNRNLQVRLPRGFAVNNDPPDSGTILQALLSSNGGGGGRGLGHDKLVVRWATRRQAEVAVATGTPGYFGSVNVYY